MNYRYLDEDSKLRKKRILKIIFWIIEIIFIIFLAYFIIAYGVERTTMVGESMKPIIEDGNKIIINKMSYRFTQPKRFDIIVFKQSGKEHGYYFIKRVIGLPGETVLILDGEVYINNEKIEEKIMVEPCVNGGMAEEAILLEEDEYFVLGDNRNNSEDSRFANIGNVIAKDIIGKAWIRLKPFDFLNLIEN